MKTTVQVQFFGGRYDGRVMDVPVPLPPRWLLPYIGSGSFMDEPSEKVRRIPVQIFELVLPAGRGPYYRLIGYGEV